jgi:hypothetical protein
MATFCAISRAEKKSTKKQVTRKQPEKKETNQPRLTEVIRNGHGAIFLFPILRRKERSECKEESVLCSLPVITTVIIAVVLLVFFFSVTLLFSVFVFPPASYVSVGGVEGERTPISLTCRIQRCCKIGRLLDAQEARKLACRFGSWQTALLLVAYEQRSK